MTGEHMKRISKISAVLIALALVFPALAHGVDTYDEQHLASPAPAKNFQATYFKIQLKSPALIQG